MIVDTGTCLNDRYTLTERIATGGMGEVWVARDEVLGRDVAVKLLKREYADDPTFLERFRAEARHTAALAHHGIAGIFDYGEVDGTAYLVMELVRGNPLSAILATDGRLSAERTLDIVAQAARALEAAHQGGVVHRDVKPGNILVCPDGTVKITDFGIARATDAVPLTKTGTVMGSAHYVSPEQANGGAVTYASDVYSLGVVAYECLAGQRPFGGDTPIAIAMGHLYEDPPPLPADVPQPVDALIVRALAKEPEERFPSAAAFAQAADAVRAGLSTPDATLALPVIDDDVEDVPVTEPVTEPGQDWRAQRWFVVAAVAAVLALLLGIAVWAALRPPPETTVPRVTGLAKAAAVEALDERGLDATEKTAYSDSVRRGLVVRQDPKAGTVLREGDDVSITISRGPQPVRVPDGLSGRPLLEVVAALERLGLNVERIGEVSATPFGTVTSVTPASGLHRGDTVTVKFSLGLPRPKGDKKGKGEDD